MSSTDDQSQAIVHTFVVGDHTEDSDGVELRITASAGYRPGLVPTDPVVGSAAQVVREQGGTPTVYVTDGHREPARWTRFDDVVAVPATDGSPILRFRGRDGGLPSLAFRAAAKRTFRILVLDARTDPTAGRPTVVLLTSAEPAP